MIRLIKMLAAIIIGAVVVTFAIILIQQGLNSDSNAPRASLKIKVDPNTPEADQQMISSAASALFKR